jgi:hypothetical protein
MKHIEDSNRNNHHSTIKRNEVTLMSNQVPRPTLRQLNGPINTPNINANNGQHHRRKQRNNRARKRLQQPMTHRAADKVSRAEYKDGNREQLEDNSSNHNMCAWSSITTDLAGFARGDAAADGLDD